MTLDLSHESEVPDREDRRQEGDQVAQDDIGACPCLGLPTLKEKEDYPDYYDHRANILIEMWSPSRHIHP